MSGSHALSPQAWYQLYMLLKSYIYQHCLYWSNEHHSKALGETNLWTDKLMNEKWLEYNVAKDRNSKVNSILGTNNKKLWPYSVNNIIPPALYIPLEFIQNLWDDAEKYIATVPTVSDKERASQSCLVIFTEQDVTLTD